MKEIISKELLSAVLKLNISYAEECDYRDNILGVWIDINNPPIVEINIYELAHKCKEWAWFTYSYQISSMFINLEFKTAKELSEALQCQAIICNQNGKFVDYFDAKSEPEAIFKACQWILDNKDKS